MLNIICFVIGMLSYILARALYYNKRHAIMSVAGVSYIFIGYICHYTHIVWAGLGALVVTAIMVVCAHGNFVRNRVFRLKRLIYLILIELTEG